MNNDFDKMLDEISSRVLTSDLDYIQDGFLFCGNCKTKKETIVKFLGIEKKVSSLCKCKQEEYIRQEQKAKEIQHNIYISRLKKEGVKDKAYLNWTFATDDRSNIKLSDLCHRYVDKWEEIKKENIGLILSGGVGTGKTFYACCIANALLDKGKRVLITNFAKILSNSQNLYDDEKTNFYESLESYGLIVIDDLGIERSSEFALEQMFNVIDTRYRSNLPIIITTNLSPQELKNPSNVKLQRIYDRILEMCKIIIVEGKSRRKTVSLEKEKSFNTILGI